MGTTSQQFCLKWNNHSSNMLNVFETLLTSEQLVDVTLACDGLSLKAHKMVLSACSPFFQSLFQENPCKHPIVILKDIRYADLKAIIDFMYKGEVNVGQAHLSALLKTAETLKVKGLAEVSGEDGQSSSGSVVQQEVPVYPQAQHSSDVANIVQTIDSSVRPSSDSPTGRKRKRTKWKNRGGQSGGGNDSETDDQGPAAKNQEIVSADVIEDDSSSIGVVDGPSDTRNAKDSRIIIEEATIVGDYVEPAALMEQNMTTDNVQPVSSQLMLTNATSKDNNINVPESRSYDTTVATMNPETVDLVDRPEDVKPTALVSYEEPPMSPNATSSHHSQDDSNSMTMYMDPNSMPAIAGPSNYQQDKQPSASAGQDILTIATKAGLLADISKSTEGEDDAMDDEPAYDSPYETGNNDFNDEYDEEDDYDTDFEQGVQQENRSSGSKEEGQEGVDEEGEEGQEGVDEEGEEEEGDVRLEEGVEYCFCRYCSLPFANDTSRIRHETTVHKIKKVIQCDHCPYQSTRTDRHRKHMFAIHQIVVPYQRKHTVRRAASPPLADDSESQTSENNIYQCYVCEKMFKTKRSVMRHTRELHSENSGHSCSFCGKHYTRKDNLTKHIETVHNIIM